ncbi:MAG: zinc ribbon domain-containing protein [Lachnospiraceae bacterium]|nr:zinc ribbon domain-containing protein [Lachnospiraceae bacterium]MBQ9592560.1 zinc ribbon domain-containing protein [Lachnospiraceae bacterium]MBR0152830.1 zinc ribbon domain-containing protein [Lachnospiraceae bacterium]
MKKGKRSLLGTWMAIGIAIFGIVWTISAIQMDNPFLATLGVLFIVASVAEVVISLRDIIRTEAEIARMDLDEAEEEDPIPEEPEIVVDSIPLLPEDADSTLVESTNFCPYCGARVDGDYVFCRVCGKRLPE